MKSPFSSANGPNDIASLQPSTLMKKVGRLLHIRHRDAGVIVSAQTGHSVGAGSGYAGEHRSADRCDGEMAG